MNHPDHSMIGELEVAQWDRPDADHDLVPPDGRAWDLLVIGGGTAGIVAAKTAAGFGASVLLVERDRTGGDCLWTGCVPSKALLAAAHAAADARAAARLGVHVEAVRVDFAEVMAHVRLAITTIEPEDAPAALRAAGARVVHGTARLSGPDTAVVDGTTITFRQALLATGSAPSMPDIPGLAEADPFTSDTIWQLDQLPERLLVLGGGSIGCELGQAFARLGSQVTIVESSPTLLPREDPMAATMLLAAFAEEGIAVHNGGEVRNVRRDDDGRRTVSFSNGTLAVDVILVAVGRRPRTAGLGLEQAGVDTDEHGHVVVTDRLQTSNPRIWAAGDLTGYPQFTHTAGVHASTAASNAILGLRRTVDTATIPRVTFTQPEVAAFGVSPQQAPAAGLTVRDIGHDHVDRAIAEDLTHGITRLVLDGKGRVVGACIVGPRAGESLAELVLAARHGLRARDLAAAMHAYPTYADGVWKAAIAQVQDELTSPMIVRATGVLGSIRRRRVSR
jgi:pyruvate/2-oxoglutarate dehydrogenase complex dihydrolipoamide dehydrogenase (E3) component